MGIRETLNQNPAIATGGTAGIIIIALIFILWQTIGGSGGSASGGGDESYFTVDDGKTFFADSNKLVAPFDKDGKQAYQAFVYSCDGGSTKFVGYLKRYTTAAKAKIEESHKNPNQTDPTLWETLEMSGAEYRKPGDPEGKWINQAGKDGYAQWSRVVSVKCPDGKTDTLEPVLP